MKDKLAYVSELTNEEVKQFTCYEKYKETIDAITGRDNLDFEFKQAQVSEFVIKMTLPDGSTIFLPIVASDGEGFRRDNAKGYSTIQRPETEEEVKRRKKAEREQKKLAKQEAEEKAKAAGKKEKSEEGKLEKSEKVKKDEEKAK